MKIWITHSAQPIHPIEQLCLDRWNALSSFATVNIVPAAPYEIHGELLSRIWNSIRSDPEPVHLISESDFWYANSALLLHERMMLSKRNKALQICTSFHRDTLPDHPISSLAPLTAPWWILIDKSKLLAPLPVNWLDAAGPRNDAANLAYLRGVESGSFYEHTVSLVLPHDVSPNYFRGANYTFGTHFMWTRHWSAPPTERLFRDDPHYTVGDHLRGVKSWLERHGYAL